MNQRMPLLKGTEVYAEIPIFPYLRYWYDFIRKSAYPLIVRRAGFIKAKKKFHTSPLPEVSTANPA